VTFFVVIVRVQIFEKKTNSNCISIGAEVDRHYCITDIICKSVMMQICLILGQSIFHQLCVKSNLGDLHFCIFMCGLILQIYLPVHVTNITLGV